MFNRTCKFVLLLTSVSFCCLVKAQSVSILATNTSFVVATHSQITSSSTITSSFKLSVSSGNKAYSLKAAVTAKAFVPNSTVFAAVPFTISLRSVTGVTTSGGVTGNIQLVENPPGWSTLATNATKTGGATAQWTYDLTLLPIGYTIAPGTYIFTVTIQYSDGPTPISRTFNITLIVSSAMGISLIQNSSTNISFASATALETGVTNNNFHNLQVKSNNPWIITASAPPFFTPTTVDASVDMPCSIIEIRQNGVGNFMPLSTLPQTIKTGNAGDVTSSFDMKFTPGYTYNPGIYNIAITYTVTAQ